MFASKIFLTVIGVVYLVLAVWCVMKPHETAKKVGYQLEPGSGESEYMVVYGGLQFALALVFLWPWLDGEVWQFALMTCLMTHASLVVLRTASFFLFTGIRSTTFYLAGGEWVILIASAIFLWINRKPV